jgi:hypothetical protein
MPASGRRVPTGIATLELFLPLLTEARIVLASAPSHSIRWHCAIFSTK